MTELPADDKVQFQSFREDDFWRRIDYAMHEDFPTGNTSLYCWVDGKRTWISLYLTFNLPMAAPSVPLLGLDDADDHK